MSRWVTYAGVLGVPGGRMFELSTKTGRYTINAVSEYTSLQKKYQVVFQPSTGRQVKLTDPDGIEWGDAFKLAGKHMESLDHA